MEDDNDDDEEDESMREEEKGPARTDAVAEDEESTSNPSFQSSVGPAVVIEEAAATSVSCDLVSSSDNGSM